MDVQDKMMRALALAQAGKPAKAIGQLKDLVAKAPDHVAGRYNLALLLLGSGAVVEALFHLDRILASVPNHPQARYSKARALMALGRAEEALPLLRSLAVTGDPDCLLTLGNAYRHLNRPDEAAAVFAAVTRRTPRNPAGFINLALCLMGSDADKALGVLQQATAHHPRNPQVLAMLGQCLMRLERFEESVAALQAALALAPGMLVARGHLMRACRALADWDGEEEQLAVLRAALADTTTRRQFSISTQDALFFAFPGNDMRQVASNEARFRCPADFAATSGDRRTPPPLIVGYLSPDFRDHATMHLAGDLFAHHDRARVHVIGYSVGPDDGTRWRERIADQCDRFVDLSTLGDDQAARRIQSDGVHILVDMSVYTRHARPGIAARRPAPIQMAWLGLAASSGAPWIDYAVVDPVLVLPDHRSHFIEKLVFLPDTYQVNQAWTEPVEPPSRSELGLPEGALVLCSFNSPRKLDRATFSAWLAILARLPDSVLWLLEPSAIARTKLECAAQSAGIDPGRLVWACVEPRERHLRRLAVADMFLDSLICGAHTTAADALRMGVPLVTVAGDRMATRVAASLLHALGLNELVTADSAAMIELAVTLGRDRGRLTALRHRLRDRLPRSPLFDPSLFARHLEQAYEMAWNRFASGLPPDDLRVSDACRS